EKHAVHRADKEQIEAEEFVGAVGDVPGEEDAGYSNDAGEEDEGERDAVSGEGVVDACEARGLRAEGNPVQVDYGDRCAVAVSPESSEHDSEAGKGREQGGHARQDRLYAARQHEERGG